MTKYRLIYFLGPDGTGKTTYADLTMHYIRSRGYRAWRARVKQHHTLSFLLLKLLYRTSSQHAISYYGFQREVSWETKTAWKALELISLLPAVTFRVLVPLLLGYVVVCDRYVLDTLVCLSYFLKEPPLVSGLWARILTKLIPKESLLINLDADTSIILQRRKEEPLTAGLIEYYKRAYRSVIKSSGLDIRTIDTSSSTVRDIHENILHFMTTAV